jgi:hypothetical protein
MEHLLPFLVHNWALVLIAVVSGTLLLAPGILAGTRPGVTPGAAVQLINRDKAVVVDVSESDEFAAGHIVGARKHPGGRLPAAPARSGQEQGRAADPGVRHRRPRPALPGDRENPRVRQGCRPGGRIAFLERS